MFVLLYGPCDVSTRDVKNKEQKRRCWTVRMVFFFTNLILLYMFIDI